MESSKGSKTRWRRLAVREAKGRKGGVVYESDASDRILGMYDYYGNPFHVILNVGYEDRLVFEHGGEIVSLRGKQVAVYTAGKDGKLGTKDDVKSW